MRVCSVSGCPRLYPSSEGSRCQTHRKEARASRVDNAVYSSKGHRRFREAVLTASPICSLCEIAVATVADHYPLSRRELVERGLDPNQPSRGRGLCAACHNKHTAATSPGGWAATN